MSPVPHWLPTPWSPKLPLSLELASLFGMGTLRFRWEKWRRATPQRHDTHGCSTSHEERGGGTETLRGFRGQLCPCSSLGKAPSCGSGRPSAPATSMGSFSHQPLGFLELLPGVRQCSSGPCFSLCNAPFINTRARPTSYSAWPFQSPAQCSVNSSKTEAKWNA